MLLGMAFENGQRTMKDYDFILINDVHKTSDQANDYRIFKSTLKLNFFH